MENFFGSDRSDSRTLKIHIYDRELQLIHSGKYYRKNQQKLKHQLNQCSLLFKINNTGYFLKNG